MCMYVCVSVCVHVCVSICLRMCVCVCVCVCAYMCAHINVQRLDHHVSNLILLLHNRSCLVVNNDIL